MEVKPLAGRDACTDDPLGSGGATFLFNCDYWLSEEDYRAPDFEPFGTPDVTCGGGGEAGTGGEAGAGGEGGTVPALRSVCEMGVELNSAHPVYHCLAPLVDQPCAPDHEERVRACLTQPAPCQLLPPACGPYLDSCPALDEDTCTWAHWTRSHAKISSCYGEVVPGESCEARFMRCAWGL